jgi:oligoendopeptidase F
LRVLASFRRIVSGPVALVPGVALAATGFAALALLGLAQLAAAALVGLGLAGGQRIDAGACRPDRQGDEIDCRAGKATAKQEGRREEKNHAHLQSDSRLSLIWDETTKRFVDPVLPVAAPAEKSGPGTQAGLRACARPGKDFTDMEVSRRDMMLTGAALLAFVKGGSLKALAQAAAPAGGAAWDLTDLYATDAAWTADKTAIQAEIARIPQYRGTLGRDAASLRTALQTISDLTRKLLKLYIYASLKADEDLRVAPNQERKQQAQDVFTALGEATAWVEPEILTVGQQNIDRYVAAEQGLTKFRFYLANILRRAPHTLGEESERVLAASGSVLQGPNDIRDQLASSDIPRPDVTLSTGRTVRLDDQGYSNSRSAPNRADRKLVFDRFWASYKPFESSLGAALAAKVRGDMFQARSRHYRNSLEAALSGDNIPESVYRTLVQVANEGLPTLHRYFALRQRMLNLPDLAYYDIYPPLVASDRHFSLAEMRTTVLEAVRPLGPEYGQLIANGTAARWMDPFPRQGKASGAYMNGGVYDTHPYLLLNLAEDYSGLTTYAHEWGHAIHTLLSKSRQPFETSDYATFTAEIASTTNEQLLAKYMLDHARTDEEKLFYLGQQMEQFRGTFYRQTMFAEFELRIHDMAEAGEGLSGERFTALYLELLRKYHGTGMQMDPLYAIEWAFIPHFYRNFYVFQYATSISGATFFAQSILNGGVAERERYLDALRAGGSDYPTEILRRAGVDMTTPAPYRALIAAFGRTLDEAERILAARHG